MNGKKLSVLILLVVLTIIVSACGGSSSSSTSEGVREDEDTSDLKLTLVGGSAGGLWSLIGEGIGNIIYQSEPNTQFSYVTGNGVSNVISVANGENPLGMAYNFEAKAGLEGVAPFKEKVSEVKALATLYNNSPLHFVISKEFVEKHQMSSIEDIKEKKLPIRIAVNQQGILSETVTRLMLESYGITYEDIENWGGQIFYEPYKVASDLMKDNKIDMTSNFAFVPDAVFTELSSNKDLTMFSLNENAQKSLDEQMSVKAGIIPANSYDFQTEDVSTVFGATLLMASPAMSDDEAYLITKILVENIEEIKALHPSLGELTPEIMAEVSPATLHPGAEKYFKEAGIIQ